MKANGTFELQCNCGEKHSFFANDADFDYDFC
jgi:hypothetical protein